NVRFECCCRSVGAALGVPRGALGSAVSEGAAGGGVLRSAEIAAFAGSGRRGCGRFNGRPASLAELKAMTAAVPERGVDGVTYWNAGPGGLAHRSLLSG